MSYLSLEKLLEARKYISEHTKKPDTFFGLVLFLICVVERRKDGSYIKSDMKLFSELADDAFYLSENKTIYNEKYWFALLTNDWLMQVKNYFLKDQKIPIKHVLYSLFWRKDYDYIHSIISKIPQDILGTLFDGDVISDDFIEVKPLTPSDLLEKHGGNTDALTIKFDGSFVKKKAGDLSGAPFGQTLYAATEIKKIISIYDFDFIAKFNLDEGKVPACKKNLGNIKERFHAWMINIGLAEKTADSYSGNGIEFCSKFIGRIGLKNSSLYELTSKQVLKSLEKLKEIPEWEAVDRKSNSMYSSACKKLGEFLALNLKVDTLVSKPFLLLAGISGTGKTRFVREQAKLTGSLEETYCLTSVRPDWHEPSDLLGYISRLNGPAEYITTDVLEFIAKAWRAILDAGFTVEEQDIAKQGKRLVVTGDRDELSSVLPYWLCLDEMNLAPVEQYFADYLSILETREWSWSEDEFTYLCDALLKPITIKQVADNTVFRNALGFSDVKYDSAWGLFCQHGLSIPFNLIVAGTVNMDETTHGFSRKVIDRALSFDFGEFFPNDFEQFFTSNTQNKALSYPIYSQAQTEDLAGTIDEDGTRSVAFLKVVNEILSNTPFQLAYRALNELLLAVINQNPQDELMLKAIWDDFLMCKVLPRIEGDLDKLGNDPTLLQELSTLLEQQFSEIWNEEIRPDLYREQPDGSEIKIACRSKAKLAWMQKRLTDTGFTSFWP